MSLLVALIYVPDASTVDPFAFTAPNGRSCVSFWGRPESEQHHTSGPLPAIFVMGGSLGGWSRRGSTPSSHRTYQRVSSGSCFVPVRQRIAASRMTHLVQLVERGRIIQLLPFLKVFALHQKNHRVGDRNNNIRERRLGPVDDDRRHALRGLAGCIVPRCGARYEARLMLMVRHHPTAVAGHGGR